MCHAAERLGYRWMVCIIKGALNKSLNERGLPGPRTAQ